MTLQLQLHNSIKATFFILLSLLSNWMQAQCGELFLFQDSLIKSLRVETREAYLAEIKDKKASSQANLAYFISYNKLGNITTFHSKDTTGTYPVETYKYTPTNNLQEVKVQFKNKPERDYTLKKKYNEHGKMISEYWVYKEKAIFRTDFKYDKNKRLKKEIVNYIRVPATRAKKMKYIYDENNRVVRKEATGYKYIAHEMVYDESGNRTHTYRIDRRENKIPYLEKEYNAKNQLIKAINYGPYLLLCDDKKGKNEAEDILVVNYTYHDNGLVATEEVRKNEILIYFWEYDYVFFSDKK